MAVTLDQAQQASAAVDEINQNLNNLNEALSDAQNHIAILSTFNPVTALAAANDKLAAIQAEITAATARLSAMTTVVNNYNTANPGSAIAVG